MNGTGKLISIIVGAYLVLFGFIIKNVYHHAIHIAALESKLDRCGCK